MCVNSKIYMYELLQTQSIWIRKHHTKKQTDRHEKATSTCQSNEKQMNELTDDSKIPNGHLTKEMNEEHKWTSKWSCECTNIKGDHI